MAGTWREPFSCSLTFGTRIVLVELHLERQDHDQHLSSGSFAHAKAGDKAGFQAKRDASAQENQTVRDKRRNCDRTCPAVAIALLDKTEQPPGAPSAALEVLAAAAAPSEVEGNVRVQLMFENGAVLPVEMSADAGAALSKGLQEELPKQ